MVTGRRLEDLEIIYHCKVGEWTPQEGLVITDEYAFTEGRPPNITLRVSSDNIILFCFHRGTPAQHHTQGGLSLNHPYETPFDIDSTFINNITMIISEGTDCVNN